MWRLAWLAALALTVGACAESQEPTPEVDTSRIVTLSGDLTEFVYALGAGDQVVGVDVTTVSPDEALELPIVGVGRFITAEGVLSVEPTLVLGDSQTAPEDALGQIEDVGVHVERLPIPTDFESFFEKLESLGELLGRQQEAADLATRLERELDEATADALGTDLRVAYVYARGPDVLLFFGDGMVTRPIIEAAGVIDAGAASGIKGTVPVSAEALVAAAPDVFVLPEEGLSILGGVEAFLDVPGVSETPAGEAGAILVYPEGDFLTFGPRIAESIKRLIDDLNGLAR